MVTDWLSMRRAAAEIDRELRSTRALDAGLVDDGRVGIRFGARRGKGDITLVIDPFGTPPLVTLEDVELSLAGDPGWVRALAVNIRNQRVASVRARRGDRVIAIDLGSTSRFGVASGVRVVLELVPRFGNVLVTRENLVIVAAKQFSLGEGASRRIEVGAAYEPPPLGEILVPRLIEASIRAEAAVLPWPTDAAREQWVAGRAAGVLASTDGEPDGLGAIHAYYDAQHILVAAHVLPLAQYAALEHRREPALLPLWQSARASNGDRRRDDARERRRRALAGRIVQRNAVVERERTTLAQKMADAGGRDRLRRAGDLLHTYAPQIALGADTFTDPEDPTFTIPLDPLLDANANAAVAFARYRKATDALPHLAARAAILDAKRESLDDLAFEVERADAATLDDIEVALDALDGRKRMRPRPPSVPRKPLRIDRPSGARIYVGRSPAENVDVTFRIARPDDLWFHARGIPGSHVVLQVASGSMALDADISLAADLAALHSRAKAAGRVEIDFTERKHVRKQRDAAPGLVWYTNARTRVGRPDQAEPSGAAAMTA